MLPNEVFALACRAYYAEQGLIVDETNGEFAHCPLPREMGDKGYYLLWEHHQRQGLLQSRDVGRRCFWVGHAKKWLEELDYFPDNYFELWDIFEEFSQPSNLHILHSLAAKEKRAQAQKGQKVGKVPTQMIAKLKKPVELSYPDGDVKVFPSAKDAGESIGASGAVVAQWARKGWLIKTKRFKGYSARYV
jgi:hypothetical protein